ncbi:Ran-binding protein 10 [Balamuthia mandrillaris]
MESQTALQLSDLPFELFCMALDHLEAKELFPCFLVSSWFLHAANNDNSWRLRCVQDFNTPASSSLLEEAGEKGGVSSWKELYKLNSDLSWDVERCTKNPASTFSEHNRVVAWQGGSYFSVRSKRCFTKSCGLAAFEFVVRNFKNGHSSCLGVVDDSWDCEALEYKAGMVPHSFMWWTHYSLSQDILGSERELQIGRHLDCAWQTGDVVGVLINFHDKTDEASGEDSTFGHTIHFFLNGAWKESMAFPDSIDKLWPVINLYSNGDVIEIRPCQKSFYQSKLLNLTKEEHEKIQRYIDDHRERYRQQGWQNEEPDETAEEH